MTVADAGDAKVLVMLSGGLDSAVLAGVVARALPPGRVTDAFYLRSGHPADVKEIEAASRIANQIGSRLDIVAIPELLSALRADRVLAAALTSLSPFGSNIALSVMMLCAIRSGAAAIYVGCHRDDGEANESYSRAAIDSLEALAASSRAAAPKIIAPFLDMTKADVLKLGAAMDAPYALTWSCMRAEEMHCGECLPCRARRRAFAETGLADPTHYSSGPAMPDAAGVKAGAHP